MKLWLNGVLQDEDAARIDPADRGFTLGDGVFETVRVLRGNPVFWQAHMDRLAHAAGLLGIPLPFDGPHLHAAIASLLAANNLPDAAVRMTLTRGPAPRGVLPLPTAAPTVLITSAALPARAPPARAIIAAGVSRDETSVLAGIKSVNYLTSILAQRQAAGQGADDAILLNRRGHLAEATSSNVFLVIGDEILTPRIADGALPGIARAALLASFPIRQASLTPADAAAAQAGFFSNALALRPLAAIGGTLLNPSHPILTPLFDWFERG